MTTPRDARDGAQVTQEDAMTRARNLVLAYDMACDAHSKAHRLYLCGDGKQACADKAQLTEEAMHAARGVLIAALATPPAPDRTLAELVDSYGEAMRDFGAANEAWERFHAKAAFTWRETTREWTNTTYAALLAYQPPAPVSRAGAGEDAIEEALGEYTMSNIEYRQDIELKVSDHRKLAAFIASHPTMRALAAAEGRA